MRHSSIWTIATSISKCPDHALVAVTEILYDPLGICANYSVPHDPEPRRAPKSKWKNTTLLSKITACCNVVSREPTPVAVLKRAALQSCNRISSILLWKVQISAQEQLNDELTIIRLVERMIRFINEFAIEFQYNRPGEF